MVDIEMNEMFRSVGYEFQIRSFLREKHAVSDNDIDYEKKIASMICDRSKEANLKEIASRDFVKDKVLRKI